MNTKTLFAGVLLLSVTAFAHEPQKGVLYETVIESCLEIAPFDVAQVVAKNGDGAYPFAYTIQSRTREKVLLVVREEGQPVFTKELTRKKANTAKTIEGYERPVAQMAKDTLKNWAFMACAD